MTNPLAPREVEPVRPLEWSDRQRLGVSQLAPYLKGFGADHGPFTPLVFPADVTQAEAAYYYERSHGERPPYLTWISIHEAGEVAAVFVIPRVERVVEELSDTTGDAPQECIQQPNG